MKKNIMEKAFILGELLIKEKLKHGEWLKNGKCQLLYADVAFKEQQDAINGMFEHEYK